MSLRAAGLTSEQHAYLEARRTPAAGAAPVLDELRKVIPLGRVLEVGCGDGAFLAALLQAGAEQVTGIERFAVPRPATGVPAKAMRVVDYAATGAFEAGGPHDLVVCLELAHMLPQPQLPAFLEALASHGPLLLFSGRIPGQDGDARSPGLFLDGWERAFRRLGFRMLDFFRPSHWLDAKAPHWARQNLVLFHKGRAPSKAAASLPSAVHPFFHDRLVRRASVMEEENALLRRSIEVPFRKLLAFDEALEAGDAVLARRIRRSIADNHLKAVPDTRFVAAICAENDLMAAAHHFLEPLLAAPEPDRTLLRQAARFAESMGEPELAWAHHAAAGATRGPNGNVALLALRTGRLDWLAEQLRRPDVPAEVARLAPFLGLSPVPAGASGPPVHVVNLPTDRYRRRRSERNLARLGVEARFRTGYRPMEIPGEGRALFHDVVLDRATDGSMGHQYAEYLIWREVAAGGDEVVMTMEDDSLLLAHPAAVLSTLDLPAGWDIIFANPRLDPATGQQAAPVRFSLLPFVETFAAHAHASPDQKGFGLDCVILSREGAAKLAGIVEREGFHSVGTDWYVQSHCVPPDRIDAFRPGSKVRSELTRRFARPRFDRTLLHAFVLSPALTQSFGIGMNRNRRI